MGAFSLIVVINLLNRLDSMASDAELVLAQRVAKLEQTVYGSGSNNHSGSMASGKGAGTLIERAKAVESKINSALFTKPRVINALGKSDELKKYSNLSIHSEGIPDPSMVELLLVYESKFQQTVALLEKVENLRKGLESQHIQE